ncbi:MAG: xanthine dehydrogenase family protein molybdopterin-binding subunit, partial [Kiloniellaceae bacterium]|nr:xanthine dehydrogenase family protein molybdopterin-binding subunit [Kiloniellaceae bacterium]
MSPTRAYRDPTDERLVRGEGRYVGDVEPEGVVHACFVRSWVPHGIIERLDTGPAVEMPGVLGVWTGADLRDRISAITVEGQGLAQRRWEPFATERVRYVGQPIAVVVAAT